MKKSKKKFSLIQEYKKSFEFLKESRNYVFFVVALFFLISLVVFSDFQNEQINEIVKEELKKLVEEFQGLNVFQTICKIFFNNATVSFFSILLGMFFGVFTLVLILVNGYVIGFVSRMAVDESGWKIIFTLIPHGIFELPAVFISFALGLKIGMFFLDKNPWEKLKSNFKNSMRVFIFVVIPLLVVAAVIEGVLIILA